MRYAAPWDRTLKISTAAASIAMVGIAAATAVAAEGGGPGARLPLVVGGVFGLILAASWALAPKGFAVERGEVRIERPLFSIAIPVAEVRAAGRLPAGALRGAMRIAGTGGLFGYFGRFWTRSLGPVRAYATRMDGLVLLDTARGRFVVSPDPPERFVDDVLARATGAVRLAPEAPLERRPMPRRSRIALGVAIAVVPLALGGVFLGTWAFSPRGASVDAGGIRIERELAGPVVIPLSDVLAVDLVPCGRAGRLRRVSGYAGRSVAYGHWRSGPLGDFQLYAWRPGPYVVLDVPGERIVLTPDAPEAFADAVREGMARR